MLVAFPEEKQEEVNEGTAQFHEQLMDVVNDRFRTNHEGERNSIGTA